MASSYYRWSPADNVTLFLQLVNPNNLGSTSGSPEVSIRRIRESHGAALDGYHWNGTAFSNVPSWLPMVEFDAANNPGLYTYEFSQSLIGEEWVYHMYYRNTAAPLGFSVEQHLFTNELYVPNTSPDPIVVGPNTVMGQLELVKDGGDGDFDGSLHSLSKLGFGLERVLGLLHYNAIVDNHTYDANGQLISARVRSFDDESNVPAIPGGNEVTGLLHEYSVTAEYMGVGVLTNYQLKKVI